jgi:hypothetical protein
MEGGTGLEPVSGGFADHSVSHFAIRPLFFLYASVIVSTFVLYCKDYKT